MQKKYLIKLTSISYKVKHTCTTDSAILLQGVTQEKLKHTSTQTSMQMSMAAPVILIKNWKQVQMPIIQLRTTQKKEKKTCDTHNNMDESQHSHAE